MPRKAKIEAHRGVYQKVKGSDLWWVRWVDVKGQRRTICAGNHSAAVTLADSKQLEKRTAQVLPAIPRRGVKFREVVEIGVKYSEDAKQGDAKGFKHRAETAPIEFGSRAADSITVGELQEWLNEMAADLDWAPGTYNRHKSALSTFFREAQRAGLVVNNPMRLVRRKAEPDGRLRYLFDEEEALLREKIVGPLNGAPCYPGSSSSGRWRPSGGIAAVGKEWFPAGFAAWTCTGNGNQSGTKWFSKWFPGQKRGHWPWSRYYGKSFISTDLLIDVSS
jgi:hypothetical protein